MQRAQIMKHPNLQQSSSSPEVVLIHGMWSTRPHYTRFSAAKNRKEIQHSMCGKRLLSKGRKRHIKGY